MPEPSAAGVPTIFNLKGLPRSIFFGRLLFWGMVALTVTASVVCTTLALQWVHQPFPGFVVNARTVVTWMGPNHWTGVRAGLKFPDKILAVDSRPVSSPEALYEAVTSVVVGTPLTYTVEKDGQPVQITVPTMRFTWYDLFVVFGTGLFIGVSFALLGIVVFIVKPDTSVSWAFHTMCFLTSLITLLGFDVESTHLFIRIYHFANTYCAAAVFHLSLFFPEPWLLVKRHPWITTLPYLLSTALFIPMELLYPQPGFQTFVTLGYAFLAVSVTSLLASTGRAFWKSASVLSRTRARVVLMGALFGLPIPAITPLVSSLGATLWGISIKFTILPLLIFPASIGYAIARHNLFDVDVYIKRAVGYGVMTGVVALAYFTVQTVVSTFVLRPVFGARAESVYPVVFALLVVFFFNPVNTWVQAGVEKLFFRKPYDYKVMVASIGDALSSLVDLDAILTKVISILREQMFLDRAGVVVLDPSQQACRLVVLGDPTDTISAQPAAGRLGHDDPLLSLLAREKKLITKYDIAEDPRYASVKEACGRSFSELGASLAMPLLYQDTFSGMMTLGQKKSGQFYSRDDIDLLKTASAMTATAIEQAREKEQRGALMQLFSKHVAPEVAEVLWQQREQFLDGGRPRSQKLIATVLFTDLQGFSGVSEKLDPQVLMDWLNTYMEGITRTVMEHKGVVDDYFGDGVKVNFGVPIPRTMETEIRQDAVNAVTCALALEKEMIRINALMRERALPTLRMRIGIYTGPVVAGSLGSADRMKYTTLGDTVNTAARLESYDKDLVVPRMATSPCRILIGESTWRHLDDQFETQKVGELSLKGKEEKITVFCVVGPAGVAKVPAGPP